MNRLKLLDQIKGLEFRKKYLENVLKDCRVNYLDKVYMVLDIKSDLYSKSYEGNKIQVNNDRFVAFVNTEVEYLEEEIQELIKGLS